jgi:hypothetical protein
MGEAVVSALNFHEKRRKPRRLLGRLARVQIDTDSELHFCLVKDISDGGVRIHANGVKIPDTFLLLFPEDGPTQSGNYRVVWRLGEAIGAEFIGAGPSAKMLSQDIVTKGA